MSVDTTTISEVCTSDESLAVEMRDHADHAAYVQLLDRHTRAVLAYCKSRIFRGSDAEDIAQEVWLKVWDRRDQFSDQGSTSFRRWLFTIAGRNCIDANRKKRPDPTDDQYIADLGDEASQAPDWIACLAERQKVLEACIAELPERQQCIVRATLEGDKTGIAASKCNCTAAQASTAKHQAVRSLKDCTESKGV